MRVRDGVSIVPGMRCTNPLGAPDVMRGEETQLLGAQALHAPMGTGKQLVCMPGTHTKWVSLNGSVVQEFLTAPTGELFAMLCEHSVLVRDPATPIEHHPRDFERGLAESAQTSGSLAAPPTVPEPQPAPGQAALGRRRGIVDVGAAHRHRCRGRPVAVLTTRRDAPVYVIGAPKLNESYAHALARSGRTSIQIDGAKAALAGLGFVYREQERAES